jgi:hypothetical protein
LRIKANNIKAEPVADTEIESAVEQKLDEVAALLSGHRLNNETLKHFQQKFDSALQTCVRDEDAIAAFNVIDEKEDASREELLEEFSMLLLSNKVDSKVAGKYLRAKRINNILLIAISLVIITLGLSMIIMPAPRSFEMFTIYYFTLNDGITLMDVIACIIILIGIYMLIRTLYQEPLSTKKND